MKHLKRGPAWDWTPALDAQLMDAVADGLSFRGVAKRVGCSFDQASSRFRRLREAMGWQAS